MYIVKILTEIEKGAEKDYYNKQGTGEPVSREGSNVGSVI